MSKRVMIMVVVLVFIFGISNSGFAAKVPAPKQGGEGFKSVSLEEAKKLYDQGATFVACHSHTTDFMKGHPPGTIHITCLVPKDHKRADMQLSQTDFDVTQLPKDKNTPIITYCASNT